MPTSQSPADVDKVNRQWLNGLQCPALITEFIIKHNYLQLTTMWPGRSTDQTADRHWNKNI